MAATLGTGTTIVMPVSSFDAVLISIDGPSNERASVDTTTMATTAALTKIPASLHDGGTLTLEVEFDGTVDPPIDAAIETAIVIDWAGAGVGSKWTFGGFCTGFTPSAAIDERMTASMTIEVTGAITIS